MSAKRRRNTIGEKYGCYTIIKMVYGTGKMICVAKCEICGREKVFQYYNLKRRTDGTCICDRKKYKLRDKPKIEEYTPETTNKVYTCIVCGRIIKNAGLRKFCKNCFQKINQGAKIDIPCRTSTGVARKLLNLENEYAYLGM